jgi:hypothetical protein
MKKLALLFFVFLGLAGVAQAQNKQEDEFVLTMPITAPCLPADNARNSLKEKHGERPFAQGIGVIWNSRIQDYIEAKVLIFLNPESFSFTVAYEVPGDNLICIVSTGDSFQPVPRGQDL